MQPTLKLTPRGLAWLRSGHLWIYRDDLAQAPGDADHGAIARVTSSTGTHLGQGFVSARSKIALRIIGYEDQPADRTFFERLILRARDRRGPVDPRSAYRLVSSEGDLWPGLIIDVYAGHFVIQSMIAGVDNLLPMIVEIIESNFSPASITLRNDVSARAMEGLEREKAMLSGEEQRAVAVVEGPVQYLADLWEGHKTGAYLDQSRNRIDIAKWAPAEGRALDAFCYQGHFALHLAARGMEVVALDSSGPALARLRENFDLNNLAVDARKHNVFEEMAALDRGGERFDAVALDPPPFAKSRKDVASARKGYRELNRRAMSLLNPGGVLFTYSCSSNFSARDLEDTLRDAAADSRRHFQILDRQTQAPDHPVILSMPETSYLKGFALQDMG